MRGTVGSLCVRIRLGSGWVGRVMRVERTNVHRAGVEGATYGVEARTEKCAVFDCRRRRVERVGVPQVEGLRPVVERGVRSALRLFD